MSRYQYNRNLEIISQRICLLRQRRTTTQWEHIYVSSNFSNHILILLLPYFAFEPQTIHITKSHTFSASGISSLPWGKSSPLSHFLTRWFSPPRLCRWLPQCISLFCLLSPLIRADSTCCALAIAWTPDQSAFGGTFRSLCSSNRVLCGMAYLSFSQNQRLSRLKYVFVLT